MTTPDQIVEGLNNLSALFDQLTPVASTITILNAPLIVIGAGPFPKIIAGLSEIVAVLTCQTYALKDTKDSYDAKGDDLVAALDKYSKSNAAFLSVLIGKAGLLSSIPVVKPPVATVLRQLEAADDTIIATIVDKTPSKTKELTALAASTDNVQSTAVNVYSDY